MTKRNKDAELVLTRFNDLKAKADATRADLNKLTESMRVAETLSADVVPETYIEAWAGAIHTVRAAVEMVEATKGIAEENALLHRALQEKQLVTYPGPVA